MRKNKKNKFIVAIILIFVVMQFAVSLDNLPFNPKKDFIVLNKLPEQESSILRRACYDCHSEEAEYPWYLKIAPVSWYIKWNINKAKEYVNFSDWKEYNYDQKDYILKKSQLAVKQGTMPLRSYFFLGTHANARLNEKEKKELIERLKNIEIKAKKELELEMQKKSEEKI